jgi:hypothetical protein
VQRKFLREFKFADAMYDSNDLSLQQSATRCDGPNSLYRIATHTNDFVIQIDSRVAMTWDEHDGITKLER